MTMGQEEQRAIHPFFRRELAVSTGPIGQPPATNHPPKGPDLPHQQPSTIHAPALSSCPEPSATSVATLDHDPNSNRRKRRKTDKDKPSDAAPGQGSVVTYVISKNTRSRAKEATPAEKVSTTTRSNAPASPEPDARIESGAPPAQGPNAPLTTPEPGQEDIAPTGAAQEQVTKRRSPRQKMIKLNPNGKLLPSPVTHKVEDISTKKKVSKRSKANAQRPAGSESKVVIIKYGNRVDGTDRVGKLINDILTGQKKHGAFNKTSLPAAPAASTVGQQPMKPTHPFFLKKATRKPDTPVAQSEEPNPPRSEASAGPESTTRSLLGHGAGSTGISTQSSTSFTSFKHRRSKFPEPFQPIWPPRDLVHVRGIEECPNTQGDNACYSAEWDRKKAKMAAVSISDNESVLSQLIRKYSSEPPHRPRIPSRHAASGKVIQTAVTRQLWATSDDKKSLAGSCHPALTKLHSLLLCSMAAFDRGVFDTLNWAQKYAPQSAEQVLQTTREVYMLRDWLKYLMVSIVDTGKSSKNDEKAKKNMEERKRKKRKKENLDGFIVSSEDEAFELDPVNDSDDELAGDVTTKRTVIRSGDFALSSKPGAEKSRVSNAILLSGPSGCGKTASVYAVAKELDFEVFEINPGNRRSAKDIVERVGDMTRNHLVHNPNPGEVPAADSQNDEEAVDHKQNRLVGVFKSHTAKESTRNTKPHAKSAPQQTDSKRPRHQKQSLILLEEADVLFEEDKQFWSGVLTLISQSKRPIIITCNDENLIPVRDIWFHAILRYRAPPVDLAIDYLLLLAANEGHMLKRNAVGDLYACTGKDLRRTITELGFWCQMAVGSEKSGLDWIIDRWPEGSGVDKTGAQLRVLSLNTYEPYMGWFGRDMLMCDELDAAIESRHESLNWWQLSMQESDSMADSRPGSSSLLLKQGQATSNLDRLDQLRQVSEWMDMRGALDLLCSPCSVNPDLDIMDTSVPSMPEKQRMNYTEGYTLLDTVIMSNYSQTPAAVACTFEVLLERTFRPSGGQDNETTRAAQVLDSVARSKATNTAQADLLSAFAPIMRADNVFPAPTGRLAPSFENGLGPIAEDLGPYIRGIMAYDVRLAQYRHRLTGVVSEEPSGTKRMRQTRASRAALEGGSKAHTRKERWFPTDANPSLILATGKPEWQEILVQQGYFAVPSGGESMESSLNPFA
ncbi:P-loop containing nucleoside triphosphate hydrolase protein [Aspergillus sclerotiicarbonarius CBS 121057]|uniref:P-loop containing nucleoside triphosphate hydrolase protein n=1 Tax=Aspergillus sclerotiicarbonarius (strain CBS 121057 / IBT 28362) TaxID=1448318 RepID=A0A319ED34_ASPSB|nr:P-loop containing nucleoside triphosphate hydrolase protein [Aspergillus sclerotiicarbonarius CBS 121057]